MKCKTIKAKVAAKVSKGKDKVAAKCKGKTAKRACALAPLLALSLLLGCSTADPASRYTAAQYGDIRVTIAENARSNTVTVTIGDGALQSADSSGSTETQTATPTNTVDIPVTVKYNDAVANATAASKSVLGTIGAGLDAVLSLMQTKSSGTVTVTKTDGTAATVKCADGQCEYCEDCSVTTED